MAKLLTISIIALVLIGVFGFYRLPAGWVEPSLNTALEETLGPVKITIHQAKIRWGGWRHPLGISVHNVTLTKEDVDISLEIPNLLFSLKIIPLLWGKAEVGKCIFENTKVYSKKRTLGIISGRVKLRDKNVSLKATFQSINGTALTHLFMGQDWPEHASFSFDGWLNLNGNSHDGVSEIELSCTSKEGTLVIPGIYPHPVTFDHVHLFVEGDKKSLSLRKSILKRGNAHLNIQGKLSAPDSWLHLYKKGGDVSLFLKGKGADIPINDLHLLWPHGLSPKPRHWVVNQLSNGNADSVSTQMSGTISLKPNGKNIDFGIHDIKGTIDASGVTVDYFGQLPPAENVSGRCTFTRQKFIIDVVGRAHGVNINTGKIVIDGLHVKDQTIDIALKLEGPVRNALEVIDSAPLHFAKKLDLDPARISGQAATNLHLAFPLETDVPLKLVNVESQSKIKEGKILYEAPVNGKPIEFNQGIFDLVVNNQFLKMKGEGYLQGIATEVQWQEHFADQGIPFRRQFLLKNSVDAEQIKNFGIDVTDYLRGLSETKIRYTVGISKQSQVEGFADLTPVVMVSPLLFWQKEKNKPAHLKLTLQKEADQENFSLKTLSLIAPDLSMIAEGKRNKLGNYLEIGHLKMGKSSLKSSLEWSKDGQLQTTIWGKSIDLSYILDDKTQEPLIMPNSTNNKGIPIKVKLLLDKVVLGENNEIHNVSGEMLYKGSTLMSTQLKGENIHNKAPLSFTMFPSSNNHQQFTLESDDGGHLLQMLGAGYDLEGGHLVIKGIKSETSQNSQPKKEKSWEITGDMTIENFTINKAPLLARLLSAASLQGIVNFFSGRGIHFYKGETDFSLTPAKLTLKKTRLVSLSLGLTLKGYIDRLTNKIDFFGELIPLYMVNTFFAQIPLVGSWVSGGREDGIFMTHFTLTGNRQDPDVAINPLTSVTPGLMREFLVSQEVSQKSMLPKEFSK